MFRQTAVLTDTAFARGVLNLKQAALLYDQVVVLRTEESKYDPHLEGRTLEQLLGRDAEWLLENGLVATVDDTVDKDFAAASVTYAKYRSQVQAGVCAMLLSDRERQEPYLQRWANGSARAYSLLVESKDEMSCVPILFGTKQNVGSFNVKDGDAQGLRNEAEAAVFSLILRALPVPDAQTTWQQLLEFRNEPDSRAAFIDLRAWLSDTAKLNLTPTDIQIRLAAQLQRFEEALRVHHIKRKYQEFETIVTAPISIAENLIKLQWSEAAKALFEVGRQQIDLMEEECQLANRELRYLVHARQAMRGTP